MEKNRKLPKVGDKVLIIKMDDSVSGEKGKDWQVQKMNGKTYTVEAIEPAPYGEKHIKLEGTGIRLLPDIDDFEIVEES